MAKTIEYGDYLDEKVIEWFSKHVGPRTHYIKHSVGGKGWRFKSEQDNPFSARRTWYLTVEDEKMLMYWTLVRD